MIDLPEATRRVLVVGINYAPENIGIGKYTGELCEWLAARGHVVRMITAPPYYPAWAIWPGYAKRWFRRDSTNGVDIIRCPIWVPRKPRGLTRLLHLASFALSSAVALVYSLSWQPQMVINVAPALASAPAAWLFARVTGAKCWLHIQDFELDAAMDMGIVSVGKLRGLALAVERWLLRRFDVVSSISEQMVSRLADKGVASGARVLFPNWVDLDAIKPLTAPSPYRRELSIPDDAVVALYSGNMSLKQGLELLSESARALGDMPELYFVFGGEGPAREQLQRQCEGLANVRFLSLQPTERLSDWLGLADIHLLPQRVDVADLVMPSKLTGMLASGKPVLAAVAAGSGAAQLLQGCGLVTEGFNAVQFIAALRALTIDEPMRATLGRAARTRAVTTLGRTEMLNAFSERMEQVLRPAQATHDRQTNPYK